MQLLLLLLAYLPLSAALPAQTRELTFARADVRVPANVIRRYGREPGAAGTTSAAS